MSRRPSLRVADDYPNFSICGLPFYVSAETPDWHQLAHQTLDELAGVIAFIVLFGAAKGCLTLVRPAFVADLYGPARYASIAGVLAFAVTLAQATAPLGAGAAYDAIGRYDPILWALVVVSALSSLCLLPARPAAKESG